MGEMTLAEMFKAAVECHRTGRLQEAEDLYRKVLEADPNHAPALQLLGVLAYQAGRLELAESLIRQAIVLRPDMAVAHSNLSCVLRSMGRGEQAITHAQQALALKPDYSEALANLGVALSHVGRVEEAIAVYQRSLEQNFSDPAVHLNLGIALRRQGKLKEAERSFRDALSYNPDFAEAMSNLGQLLTETGRAEEAVALLQRATQLMPGNAEALNNLGAALDASGHTAAAIGPLQQAIAARSDAPEVYRNLGSALGKLGRLDEAIRAATQAVVLKPDFSQGHGTLGNVLKEAGDIPGALAAFQKAVECDRGNLAAYDNLLYALHFLETDPQVIRAAHRKWDRIVAPLREKSAPHRNTAAADKRLRVGYIAPDFRNHCQSLFTIPLLSHHSHDNFEITCYSDVSRPDAITKQLQTYSDRWRDVRGMDHAAVAELIGNDEIDVLVDLTQHMSGNRLLVFAMKPAPVQVSWLGYPASAGLSTIDWRLTDAYLDPVEIAASGPEQLYRLPDSFWCYTPLDGDELPVDALPAHSNGFITFGCLNNFCKVNPAVLKLWARVMRAVANSRLVLLSPEGQHRQRTLDLLVAEGIAPSRVRFQAQQPRLAYYQSYGQIDLCLDTFPYGGHTTSLDGCWMGVPVLTLPGSTSVSRGGQSILSNLQLPELIAASADDFVRISQELSGDLARLAEIRATLRERMRQSPLMDGARFARNIEEAYRKMWHGWCENNGRASEISRMDRSK